MAGEQLSVVDSCGWLVLFGNEANVGFLKLHFQIQTY